MRREGVVRLWTVVAGIAAGASGMALWHHGERLAGGFGMATALLHALCAIDLRALARGALRRRPIVIQRLRHRSDADAVRHG